MPLPPDILRTAVLGTDRVAAPEGGGDAPGTAPGPDSPEARLLLMIARSTLHERAGHLPSTGRRSAAEPCAADDRPVVGLDAMRYLHLILRGVHAPALREWCITTARAGRIVRADVLPRLLNLGQRRVEHRPYLAPVIGERGLWLACQITNQNWKWLVEIQESTLAGLERTLTQARAFEATFSSRLRSASPLNLLEVSRELRGYGLEWSSQLVDDFLHCLAGWLRPSTNPSSWRPAALTERVIPMAYYFPLEERQRILQFLGALGDSRAIQVMAEGIHVVASFRQAMRYAIAGAEE